MSTPRLIAKAAKPQWPTALVAVVLIVLYLIFVAIF